MINVTKSYLPPIEEYNKYLEGIWERTWLTNQGPLVQELEQKLKAFLGVHHLLFMSNGTIAIQLAIKALELKGEIITTPFSYVATTTSALWENCKPVFTDIENKTFCIDPEKIEEMITPNTSGILATHVYGNACDVIKIKAIADKYKLKVIYDGAHAFGVSVNESSIFNYGDITTISFHATKLFHTVEGGAIVTKNKELADKLSLYRSFGHIIDDYYTIGINGKNSEFHAAMGLCNLSHVTEIISNRRETVELYSKLLNQAKISFPEKHPLQNSNYAYFPVVFETEEILLQVRKNLLGKEISTRRYFYPSLNKLPYLTEKYSCPISEDISKRVLCLPLYFNLSANAVERICQIINSSI
jgi:dTDP-4-amino-4,6-dideoxygalactose transaminase